MLGKHSPLLMAGHAALGFFTIVVYALDKSAARRGAARSRRIRLSRCGSSGLPRLSRLHGGSPLPRRAVAIVDDHATRVPISLDPMDGT